MSIIIIKEPWLIPLLHTWAPRSHVQRYRSVMTTPVQC